MLLYGEVLILPHTAVVVAFLLHLLGVTNLPERRNIIKILVFQRNIYNGQKNQEIRKHYDYRRFYSIYHCQKNTESIMSS